ncbi:MAG: hypothetical protein AAGK17_09015 [Pseudomonadota bacterium]
MTHTRDAFLLIATVLLCSCDDAVPSFESVAHEPSIQNVLNVESGDRLICVGAIADGPCNHSTAQAIISGAANADDVSVRWDGEQTVTVRINAGELEKASRSSMDGKVTIEYR